MATEMQRIENKTQKPTTQKPTLDSILTDGFKLDGTYIDYEMYAFGKKRIMYDPKTDQIVLSYGEREGEKIDEKWGEKDYRFCTVAPIERSKGGHLKKKPCGFVYTEQAHCKCAGNCPYYQKQMEGIKKTMASAQSNQKT